MGDPWLLAVVAAMALGWYADGRRDAAVRDGDERAASGKARLASASTWVLLAVASAAALYIFL